MVKVKKSNAVQVKYLKKQTKNQYFDQSEEILLDFFDKPQSQKYEEILKILNSNPFWTLLYHLSPRRQHLLDWYPFDKNKILLDIGAGCGALTGMFCQKTKKVTCLELTEIRAKIISQRWADQENLEIVCGSIDAYSTSIKYDYINMTGVLEYAGMFNTNPEKPDNFSQLPKLLLTRTSSLLKKGGTLFIAIENSLGLRYFSGAVEDHYGELFEGVENYPQYKGIRTFTKNELMKILQELNFTNIEYYYPFPDYKLPVLVLNEDYLKNLNSNSLSSLFQNTEYSHLPLFKFFSEVLFAAQLEKENLLDHFANSFLVIAYKK